MLLLLLLLLLLLEREGERGRGERERERERLSTFSTSTTCIYMNMTWATNIIISNTSLVISIFYNVWRDIHVCVPLLYFTHLCRELSLIMKTKTFPHSVVNVWTSFMRHSYSTCFAVELYSRGAIKWKETITFVQDSNYTPVTILPRKRMHYLWYYLLR